MYKEKKTNNNIDIVIIGLVLCVILIGGGVLINNNADIREKVLSLIPTTQDEVDDKGTTEAPTATAVTAPTAVLTEAPTATAVTAPTAVLTEAPTATVVTAPTAVLTEAPTATAVTAPTAVLTEAPTATAVTAPTAVLTEAPTATAVTAPTVAQPYISDTHNVVFREPEEEYFQYNNGEFADKSPSFVAKIKHASHENTYCVFATNRSYNYLDLTYGVASGTQATKLHKGCAINVVGITADGKEKPLLTKGLTTTTPPTKTTYAIDQYSYIRISTTRADWESKYDTIVEYNFY